MGVIRSQAEEALSLLIAQYEALTLDSTTPTLPTIQIEDSEQVSRLLLAIALCGEFVQYGAAIGVCQSVGGLLTYLGITSLAGTKDVGKDDLSHAIWMCLRSVPERRITEVVRTIRRVVYVNEYLRGDWGSVAHMDNDQVRKVVGRIIKEPVAALTIMQALGADDVRPLPSGGAAGCALRLGVISPWATEFIIEGFSAVRAEAMRVLEGYEPAVFLTLEWWGTKGCPEACVVCPASAYCDALCSGLV